MIKVGLLVQLQAKAGKEAVVGKFLADALGLANHGNCDAQRIVDEVARI